MKKALFFAVTLCVSFTTMFLGCDKDSSYLVYYNKSGADLGDPPEDSKEYKEGDVIELKGNTGNLRKRKHSFDGWWIHGEMDASGNPLHVYSPGDYITMGTSNIVLNVNWEYDENVTFETAWYTIEHYKQDTDGKTYKDSPDETESDKGEISSLTNAKAKQYPGFTAGSIDQQELTEDSQTVIKIYYTRNKITYTFKDKDGTVLDSRSGFYETSTSEEMEKLKAELKTKLSIPDGYTVEWDEEVPTNFGADNKEFHYQGLISENSKDNSNNGADTEDSETGEADSGTDSNNVPETEDAGNND